jgi:hypothetical protein
MGGTSSTHGRDKKLIHYSGHLKERGHMGDVGVDEKKI